jgi:hypothetical protein
MVPDLRRASRGTAFGEKHRVSGQEIRLGKPAESR